MCEEEQVKEDKKIQAENMRLHKEIKKLKEELNMYKSFIFGGE